MHTASKQVRLTFSCMIFFFFGLFHASLGPVLNELAIKSHSSLAAIGGVLTFLFLGALISQISTGPLFDRFGKRLILTLSLILLGVSIVGFTLTQSIAWIFILFLLSGMGQGGVDMGVNLVVADSYPENNTRYLNLIHFFFGFGAFTGPLLVGLSILKLQTGLPVLWLAAGTMILLGMIIFFLLRDPSITSVNKAASKRTPFSGFQVYSSPLLWLLSFIMLIYIGVEYGLGSWVTSYMSLTTNLSIQYGALVTSAYWGSLAIGRLAGFAISKKLSRIHMLLIALGGSLIGTIFLLIFRGMLIPSIVCLIWISFSYGTVIPTTVALTSTAFPNDKGKAVSILSAMGSIGGTILPWIAGILIGNAMEIGYLLLIGISIATLILIVLAIWRLLGKLRTTT